MEPKSYAGIGSRKTPAHILAIMEQIAICLARHGWTLRSGNCKGADQAFQQGANAIAPGSVELFLPWPGYEPQSIQPGNAVHTPSGQAYSIAAQHHPAWHHCRQAARAMHARNAQIILGAMLAEPVQQVICWTPGGVAIGGTAMGIRIAKAYGLPVWNLGLLVGMELAAEMLSKAEPSGRVEQAGQMCWGGLGEYQNYA